LPPFDSSSSDIGLGSIRDGSPPRGPRGDASRTRGLETDRLAPCPPPNYKPPTSAEELLRGYGPTRRHFARVSLAVAMVAPAVIARAADPVFIWQNGFESADTCAWTATEPAATIHTDLIEAGWIVPSLDRLNRAARRRLKRVYRSSSDPDGRPWDR